MRSFTTMDPPRTAAVWRFNYRPVIASVATLVIACVVAGDSLCRMAGAVEIFAPGAKLEVVAGKGAGGEIQLTDAMAQMIGKQPFHAVTFDGDRYDCGDKAGFITANIALALARPDIGPSVKAWLKTINLD